VVLEKKKSKHCHVARCTSLPLPNALSDCCSNAGALGAAFDAMLLNPTTVANDNFIDDWGAANRDVALALSSVDNT
jgi:hypothetical protein